MSKTSTTFSSKAAPTWWLLGLLLLGFAGVRMAGMFNDLWLDEIWSVKMVETLKSPLEILTVLRHDNNHPLNSLFLYAMLPTQADWTLRLFSWFCGSASVWLAALIARRQYRQLHPDAMPQDGRMAGLLTAMLFGGAYLLIHYSSEARGYAPAVMFSLLAVSALQHSDQQEGRHWAFVYWIACAFGLLAHLSTVQVLIAGLGFSLLKLMAPRSTWLKQIRKILWWHLLPWLGFAAYYMGFVRKIEIGGGPENSLLRVLGDTAAYVLGMPISLGVGLALPIMLGLVGVGLWLMCRVGARRMAVFYFLLIFITPSLGILFSKFTLLFPRYFLFSATYALMVVGYGLTVGWLRGGWHRGLVALCVAVFLVGNAAYVIRLAEFGRGQYRAALREIATRTADPVVTIGSDHDFRNQIMVDYYQGAVAPKTITYYPYDRQPSWGVDWLLLHRLDGESPPPAMIADARGNRFEQELVYRHAALSGWDWFVYRRQ